MPRSTSSPSAEENGPRAKSWSTVTMRYAVTSPRARSAATKSWGTIRGWVTQKAASQRTQPTSQHPAQHLPGRGPREHAAHPVQDGRLGRRGRLSRRHLGGGADCGRPVVVEGLVLVPHLAIMAPGGLPRDDFGGRLPL